MHFVGPDQLHDLRSVSQQCLSSRFWLTPDYRKPGERIDWWYHNMGSVTNSGTAEITNQLEYDDEVAYEANRKCTTYRVDMMKDLGTVSFASA